MGRWVRLVLKSIFNFSHLKNVLFLSVSIPYSYSCARIAEYAEDQLEAALGASQSLEAAHGTVFEV